MNTTSSIKTWDLFTSPKHDEPRDPVSDDLNPAATPATKITTLSREVIDKLFADAIRDGRYNPVTWHVCAVCGLRVTSIAWISKSRAVCFPCYEQGVGQ